MKIKTKSDRRERIRLRQRKRITGTAERPRLAVFRSVTHIYAQVIDDQASATVAAASTAEPGLKAQFTGTVRGSNTAGAAAIGKIIAERLKEKGITCFVNLQDLVEEKLPPELQVTLFRMLQEVTTNIARHAKAQNVCISVKNDRKAFIMNIEDDGQGFDVAEARARGSARRWITWANATSPMPLSNGTLTL